MGLDNPWCDQPTLYLTASKKVSERFLVDQMGRIHRFGEQRRRAQKSTYTLFDGIKKSLEAFFGRSDGADSPIGCARKAPEREDSRKQKSTYTLFDGIKKK